MGRVKGRSGSVRQLKSGRWQAYFPARIDPHRRPIQPGVTYGSKAKALAALEDALEAFQAGFITFEDAAYLHEVLESATLLTVSAMFERFLAENVDLSPATRDQYRSVNRSVISHPVRGIGQLPALEVATSQLREWKLGLREAGVTGSMEDAAWKALSSAFSWWVDWHGMPSSPATLPQVRGTKKQRAQRAATADLRGPDPTWADVHRMAVTIPHLPDRIMMLLMAWSGPRLAEAAAIERICLNEEQREIHLRSVWVKESGQPWQSEPLKTGLSRQIPVPLGLWNALVTHVDSQWTVPKPGRVPVLFPPTTVHTRSGIGVYDRFLWRDCVWQPMRSLTGLPFQTRSLRRHAASALVDAGATILEAKTLMGHDKVETTERYYARALARTDAHEIRDRIRNTPCRDFAERLDLLYDAWVETFGDPMLAPTHTAPGLTTGGRIPRSRRTRTEPPAQPPYPHLQPDHPEDRPRADQPRRAG